MGCDDPLAERDADGVAAGLAGLDDDPRHLAFPLWHSTTHVRESGPTPTIADRRLATRPPTAHDDRDATGRPAGGEKRIRATQPRRRPPAARRTSRPHPASLRTWDARASRALGLMSRAC